MLFTFTGWAYDPDFNYAVTMWTVNSTTQVNIVGWLSYTFGRAATLYGGVGGLPARVRSRARTRTGSRTIV